MTDKEKLLKNRCRFFKLAIEESHRRILQFFEGQQEDKVLAKSIKAKIIFLKDDEHDCYCRIENSYDDCDIIDGLDEDIVNEYEYRLIVNLYDHGYSCKLKERTDTMSVYEIKMKI